MSAPSTNVETQERRHKPVLVVLRTLIGAALLALAGFISYQIGVAGDPSPSALPSVETN